ncbi:hypothetical protein Pla175_13840 [Pirellulimonas nuda]|uniref:Uncharacterized protein n=1 Tax=Pirellulimonas nuda TaxID=2528009 RepID=A0A518D975_9BACT|nr:hypothetical protein [Pirellulimonas nuda]QDU88015.1 hypothetical protein Pla175_13840 [Pirellulimonas nuda]
MRDRADILKALRQTRARLPGHAQATREAVADAFDWKTYVRAHPLLAFGLAAGVGYLLVPRGAPAAESRPACPPRPAEAPQRAATSGVISSVAATVGALALRTALSAAARHVFAGRSEDNAALHAEAESFRPRPK